MIDQGKFVVRPAMPGLNIPGHPDHGYGPLALIAESFMAPDTWITMHEHVQDEIISGARARIAPGCHVRARGQTLDQARWQTLG